MKLLIFAGPSGGHLFPAIAFAEFFRKKYPKAETILVVTPRVSSFIKTALLVSGCKIFYLPDFPIPKSFLLKGFGFLLKLAQAFLRTAEIIKQVKPDAIVAFGTFVSFPGVILGHYKKIPTVLHEQNVDLGRANKMLIPFATKVAVSFPTTLGKFSGNKGVWTGNILRPDILGTARKHVFKEGDKFQILILGGSQGASFLNRVVLQTFQLIPAEEKQKIAVIHITGLTDFSKLEHAYNSLGIENEVFPFTDEISGFYAGSDLVVARAGAGTLAEIALFGLASILIPYPYAGSHQLANARYLAERGAAYLMEESSLNPERLNGQILAFFHDREKLQKIRHEVSQLAKPDAGDRLVREVEQLFNFTREVAS